jgi:hypothetical protein
MIQLGCYNGDLDWIIKAELLCTDVISLFSDEQSVFFYFSSKLQTDIPVRKQDVYDGAMPSAKCGHGAGISAYGNVNGTKRLECPGRGNDHAAKPGSGSLHVFLCALGNSLPNAHLPCLKRSSWLVRHRRKPVRH